MTLWVVADSSIFISTVIRDSQTSHVDALIKSWTERKYQIAAPYLFRYEFTSAIRKHVARGTITLDAGHEALKTIQTQAIEYFADEELLDRGFHLAMQYSRPAAYDSFYLALAERLNCEFWTGDLKLVNAVSSSLAWVKWCGHFSPPPSS